MKGTYNAIKQMIAGAGIALLGACGTVPHQQAPTPTPIVAQAELDAPRGGLGETIDRYQEQRAPALEFSRGYNSIQSEVSDQGQGQMRIFNHYDATIGDKVTLGWKGLHFLPMEDEGGMRDGYFGIDQVLLSSPRVAEGDSRLQLKLLTTGDGLLDWKAGIYDTSSVEVLSEMLDRPVYGWTELTASDRSAEAVAFLGTPLGTLADKPVTLEALARLEQPFDGSDLQKYVELQVNLLDHLHARVELPDLDPSLARYWLGLHFDW